MDHAVGESLSGSRVVVTGAATWHRPRHSKREGRRGTERRSSMSDSGINRRDLIRRGGVTIAGASLLGGLAACGKKGAPAGGGSGGGLPHPRKNPIEKATPKIPA